MKLGESQTNLAAKPRTERKSKSIYELVGPCGRLLAQGRTPDQARGVYLARFPAIPHDLDTILVMAEHDQPTGPYCVLHRHGRNAVATVRFP